jgi:glycosyltransferase involved in cell wall biosynthesis
MEDNSLVSVIVVTYNQHDSIARTLDSILMQKCRLPIEIVVGDDASTDSTRAVCEDYVRRYPHIVRLMPAAPNKGVVDNYFDCLLACINNSNTRNEKNQRVCSVSIPARLASLHESIAV